MSDQRPWNEDADDAAATRSAAFVRAEPTRDPALGRALADAERVLYGAPNVARAAMLRGRIADAARPLLARLSQGLASRQWWEWTAHWSRAVIPIALLAGVAAAMLVVASRDLTTRVIRERTLQGQPPIMRAAVSGSQPNELMESVLGPATGEWLIGEVFAGTSIEKLREELELRDSARPER
jgi:hypothetical protein